MDSGNLLPAAGASKLLLEDRQRTGKLLRGISRPCQRREHLLSCDCVVKYTENGEEGPNTTKKNRTLKCGACPVSLACMRTSRSLVGNFGPGSDLRTPHAKLTEALRRAHLMK